MSSAFPPPPSRLVVELCAEESEACAAADAEYVDRIELCTDLDVGGLTPPKPLVEAALANTLLPVHVLLRPTAATFVYSSDIHREIDRSLREYKSSGVAGFVLGLLTPQHRIDREHTAALVSLAHPLPVTFHRAFDETPDQAEALEAVIAAGCARLLTSGGAADVVAGAGSLASLVQRAGTRIEVAVGGGLRLANATWVAKHTQARSFHASLREPELIGSRASTLRERTRELARLLIAGGAPAPARYTTAGTGNALSGAPAGR